MEWWHKIEAWGKAHPVALGAIIFIVGALIIYLLLPRKAAASGTTGPSDAYYNAVASMAASGNQLQIAQLGAQAQTAQLQDQLTAQQNQIAGQVQLATIDSQTQTGLAQISADAQSAHDKTVQESTDYASTLTAQVQTAGINAQTTIAGINASAVTDQAKINADENVKIATTNAQTQEAGYAAQLDAFKTLIGGQVTVAQGQQYAQEYSAAQQVQIASIAGAVQDYQALTSQNVAITQATVGRAAA